MKKEYVIFAAILASIAVLTLSARSLFLGMAVGQLKSAFPGYTVKVENAEIKSIDLISLSGIDIKKGDTNRYRVKELDIRFTPLTLFTRIVPKVSLDGCNIYIYDTDRKFKEVAGLPSSKAGGKIFIIESLEINDLALRIDTDDFDISAVIRADASIGRQISYNAVVKVEKVNLGLLAKSLGASEKVEIKGTMGGEISVDGKDLNVSSIKGDFATKGSGTIIIKDEDFIEKLAKQSKQPVEVIRDSFKHYDYTKGTLAVSKDKDAIVLHLLMEGLQGKRDLTVALHGF